MSQEGQSLFASKISGSYLDVADADESRQILVGRSLHGCWTCRVRKKKCDEKQPLCLTCLSLELKCDGYGDKPSWMDSGPLQREHALKVKRAVSQTNSQRRKVRIHNRSSSILDDSGMNIGHEETSGTSEVTSNHHSGQAQPYEAHWELEANGDRVSDEAEFHIWELDLDFSDKDIPSALSQENPFPIDPFFGNSQWAIQGGVVNDIANEHDLMLHGSSEYHEAPGPSPTSTPNLQEMLRKESRHPEFGVFQEGELLEANKASGSEWPLSGHMTAAPVVQKHSILEHHTEGSHFHEEIEDKLFMHYLDEVFFTQYPFYNTPHKQSRGWLFSTLRRVRSVYHATLALSEYHLQSTAASSLLPKKSYKANYHEVALWEMGLKVADSSSLSGTASLTHNIDNIACILQILFYEKFVGGTGNWQPHLVAAGALVNPLANARMRSIDSWTSDTTDSHFGVLQTLEKGKYPDADTGIKVLLGSIIAFDIIASASIRSLPFLQLDHEKILQIFEIELGSLFGCTNKIMTIILKIVLLDNWKKEAEKTRKLSIVELVKRAGKIEDLLQQQLRDLESLREKAFCSTLSASQTEISNIFALSALTYLHVVVSGAHPELPEIAESVSRTISAFQALADPTLLGNLVWPFCISGCLALEQQQAFFRDLVSKAKIDLSSVGTCFQAFGVIEECWEVRRTCSYNCDWVFIMNKRGCKLLLI